jgi:cytochrome c biogenesis protein CcdA
MAYGFVCSFLLEYTQATNLTLIVITGVITIIFGVVVYLFFPDSPLHASFLTYEERAQAVLRIKDNNSGIENKHFKKHQ